MLSTTNLKEEEIVDALGNDDNASMPEQVRQPNPWRKMMMMIIDPVAVASDNSSVCSITAALQDCWSLKK